MVMMKLGARIAICIWLLLAILSPITESSNDSNPAVLDTDGNPIQSDAEYYVRPAITDVGGYLALIDRYGNGSCPLYVGQPNVVVDNKTSIKFTPFIEGETLIRENRDFKAIFQALTTCVQSTAWKVGDVDQETGRRLIVTGDDEGIGGYFRIEKGNLGIYNFAWCPLDVCPNCRLNCSPVGAFIIDENRNRLLALDGNTLPVQFEKANDLIVSFAIYIGLLVTILSSIEPSSSSSSDANSAVLDTQGNKIQSGVEYYVYVKPDITDNVGGYLTLIDRVCNNGSCPLFIGQQNVVGDSKFSIQFTPFIEGESVVRENSYFKAISKALTLCVQSTAWKVGDQESRMRLIVACDDQGLLEGFFRIEKGNLGIYHFVWCPLELCPNCKLNCSYVGYLIDESGNRLLALDANNSSTLPLIFEKANVVSS
ncbi:hypothetical protein PIB30_005163 [Stylosanthes scabra]|uniref:Uncharacterized protein n=1 Tax=Stylosanthes scabra TaxID=79078 RepID=A0ABU6R473_9FABA|nr:hypothetical protein [Stylosanthes scabra]